MSNSETVPTDAIWQALLNGDPGPAVALFDALMDADFAFAAGGFLRDLAERLEDAGELLDDPSQHECFCDALRSAILCCLQDDEEALAALREEVVSDNS